jgi:sulfite exporter TauE/SafE
MERFLTELYANSGAPFVSAMILGLLTAISPCPLATNISAIGFISRDLEDRRRVFISGMVYTLGRAISYTGLAVILYFGANRMNVSGLFQGWGEKLIGPLLIVIGLFMLDFIRIRLPGISGVTGKVGEKSRGSYWGALLLGIVFALAFCPYSGVLYFGMLIPLTVGSSGGLYLPFVFAVATGIPVIIFAWLIAFAVGNVGRLYNHIKAFEIWFRRVVAVLFIAVGIYYVFIILL